MTIISEVDTIRVNLIISLKLYLYISHITNSINGYNAIAGRKRQANPTKTPHNMYMAGLFI